DKAYAQGLECLQRSDEMGCVFPKILRHDNFPPAQLLALLPRSVEAVVDALHNHAPLELRESRQHREHQLPKWAGIWGTVGAAWMLVLLWAHSARLVYLTNFPALLLTALFVPIDGGAFVFYASLVLCSAIQWAAIGLLARAILRSLG